MIDIYEYVIDMNLRSGETKRMDCTVCNGTNTFSASNVKGQLLWNCFKASCTVGGKDKTDLCVADISNILSRHDNDTCVVPFNMPIHVVSGINRPNVIAWADKWGLNAEELDLHYDVKEDRVVFPILHNGKYVDATGRSLSWRKPKWKRYGKNSLPYHYGHASVAVVVEDCVSAAVIGSYGSFVGVALLGTSLLPIHKQFLSQFSTAIVALDPDALTKTIKFTMELRSYVNEVVAINLNDDIKYRHPDDLRKLEEIGDKYGTCTNS